MTITLQAPVTVGDQKVAALVETTRISHAKPGHQAAWFSRRPVAILIAQGQQVSAFNCHGKPITQDEVERLCPGATASLSTAQDESQ